VRPAHTAAIATASAAAAATAAAAAAHWAGQSSGAGAEEYATINTQSSSGYR